MEDGFDEAQAKAAWIKQFSCKPCQNWWWGVSNQCRDCRQISRPVPFKKMVGVGWFECATCNRTFAGFCRGNVPSACHGCGNKCLASFIVPGSKASAGGRNHHECDQCHGQGGARPSTAATIEIATTMATHEPTSAASAKCWLL